MYKMMLIALLCVFSTSLVVIESSDSCFQYKQISQKISQVEYTVYYDCKWWQWVVWWTCKETSSYIVYKSIYKKVLDCCMGYAGSECMPVCQPHCGTNKECSAPNTCTCLPGWEGTNCSTKISACSNDDGCEEGCISAGNGLYSCYCTGSKDLARDNHTCLGGVNDFTSTAGTNTLHLSWSPPTNHSSNGTLTGYNITCYEASKMKFFAVGTNFTVSALTPFTTYVCCVEPHWYDLGTGPLLCIENTTMENAPSDIPNNVTVTAADLQSVLIQWIPPLIPNGIINHYNIYINYTNGTDIDSRNASSNATYYLLRQLKVYQLVGISVSATTGGGEGPMSPYSFGRSGKSADPVLLVVDVVSDNAVNISWSPPLLSEIPKESTYSIILRNLTNQSSETSMENWNLQWDESLHVTIMGSLEPHVPYEVSVTVNMYNLSHGHLMSFVFFTIESVPTIAPFWTVIKRVSMTTIRLEWAELTLEESRGFVTNYTIKYSKLKDPSTNNCSSSFIESVTNETELALNDLISSQKYCITIAAITGIGKGIYSEWNIVDIYPTQLVYFFIDRCQELKNQITLTEFINRLTAKINKFCNCSITSDYIYNISMQCIDEMAVVKAVIFYHENQSLIQYIKKWIEQAPFITLKESKVHIRYICTSLINCSYYNLSTAGTTVTTTSTTGTINFNMTTSYSGYSFSTPGPNSKTVSSTYIALLSSITVIILFILIAMISIIIVIFLMKKKQSSGYTIEKQDGDDNDLHLANPNYGGLEVEMKHSGESNNQNTYEEVDNDNLKLSDQSLNDESTFYSLAVEDKQPQEEKEETFYSKCEEYEEPIKVKGC